MYMYTPFFLACWNWFGFEYDLSRLDSASIWSTKSTKWCQQKCSSHSISIKQLLFHQICCKQLENVICKLDWEFIPDYCQSFFDFIKICFFFLITSFLGFWFHVDAIQNYLLSNWVKTNFAPNKTNSFFC